MSATEATERAAVLLELGRAADALEVVAPYLVSDEHPGPYGMAVAALLALQRVEDAVRTAQDALARFGPLPHLARVASYAVRAAGDPTRALDLARAGVEQDPQSSPGLFALAQAELAVGEVAAAQVTVGTLTALDPNSPEVWLLAADIALARRDRRLARRHCGAALRLDPANVAALRGLGLLDEQRNRPGSAARWYARALRLRPGDQELVDRVRALFGRLLGAVVVALVMVATTALIAFLAQADPVPGQRNPAGLPDALWWPLWVLGFGGFFVVTAWVSVRGTPRVVLDALVSETRTLRPVRRCARLVLGYAVAVVATLLVAVAPVGTAPDRLPAVMLLYLLSTAVFVLTAVGLRRTFGYAQRRAAAPPTRNAPRRAKVRR